MKNKKITYFLITILFIFCFFGFPSRTSALDEDVKNKGFSVSPGSVEDVIKPGETKKYEIIIRNNNSEKSTFVVEKEDFEFSSDPRMNGHLLGENKSDYSLKDYMDFDSESIDIEPGETGSVKVSISLPKNISLPGLYGAVLVKQKNNIPEEGVTRIIPRIGVFFYMAVDGNASGGGESLRFKFKSFSRICFEKGCGEEGERYNTFEIYLKNQKNVHLSLYGTLEVSNMVGKKIALLPINSLLVPPNSEKIKEINWKNPPRLIGVYKAKVALNNNHTSEIIEKDFYFVSIPWQLTLTLIVAALFVVCLPVGKKKLIDMKNKKKKNKK